jgi:hypothetical protein
LGHVCQGIERACYLSCTLQDKNCVISVLYPAYITAGWAVDAETDHERIPAIFFEQITLKNGVSIRVVNAALVNNRSRHVFIVPANYPKGEGEAPPNGAVAVAELARFLPVIASLRAPHPTPYSTKGVSYVSKFL